jgi:lysophospholipase L1-like esterase
MLAVATLSGSLCAAEAVLRVLQPPAYARPKGTYGFEVLAEHPRILGFKPMSMVHIRWDGDPYGTLPDGAAITYEINELGLRGPAPPRGRRVLFVGDSFTFGDGVLLEDTFVARAQAAVRRAGSDLVLVNTGIPGYGTADEAHRLPGWLTELEPIAVIVMFVLNDPIPLEESVRHVDDLVFDSATPHWGSRLLELGRRVIAARRTEAWYRSYYRGSRAAYWLEAKRLLRQMRDRCHDAGARFGIVLFPLLQRLDAQPFAALHDDVANAARTLDVPFLDLSSELQLSREVDLWVHPVDHHPNARAHGRVAGRLASFAADLVR